MLASVNSDKTGSPHLLAITVAVMAASSCMFWTSRMSTWRCRTWGGSLHANSDQITWALTTYMLAMVIATPLTGLLVERFGQRRLILWSVAGFLVCSVMSGQSHSLTEIVLWRFMQGALGASLVPVGQAILVSASGWFPSCFLHWPLRPSARSRRRRDLGYSISCAILAVLWASPSSPPS